MTSTPSLRDRLWLLELVGRVLIAFAIIAVLTHTVARPFVIPSGSMEPTLVPGDRVFARILGVDQAHLQRGQIVIFGHGDTWSQDSSPEPNPVLDVLRYGGDVLGAGPGHSTHTVKRIIGLPGETISCCDTQGRVLVDGKPLDEPYVHMNLPFTDGQDCARTPSARCFPEITVPEDSYLVLGDNRANSADSVIACRGRTSGPCPAQFVRADQIVGTLAWRIWPLPPGDAERTG